MDRGRQPFEFAHIRLGGLASGRPGPETIDMTPDGKIGDGGRTGPALRLSWPMRVAAAGVVVAVLAGFAASAVILLWLASILIPIAVVAGLVAYAAFRFQVWRVRRAGKAGGAAALRALDDARRCEPVSALDAVFRLCEILFVRSRHAVRAWPARRLSADSA